MNRTLMLNANYKPIGIISTRRAFILSYNDVIFPLLFYNKTWRDSRGNHYQVPSIVVTKRYFNWVNKWALFSKKNVLIRDLNTCQYCGYESRDLTLDHVIPKSKFIQKHYPYKCNSFENVVTACLECNYKKSDKSLKDSGLMLVKNPTKITIQDIIINKCKLQFYPLEWADYLK